MSSTKTFENFIKHPYNPKRLGERIFLFQKIDTKQIVYALHPGLNKARIVKQLPYLGKKTVPADFRPDLWQPFASVRFPKGHAWRGLLAFRKLREYRKLRDYAWDKAEAPATKKERVRWLSDHTKTAVADLAKVIQDVETMLADMQQQAEQAEEEKLVDLRQKWDKIEEMALVGRNGLIAELGESIKAKEIELEQRPKNENLRRQILKLRQERNRFIRAGEAVDAVKGKPVERSQWNKELAEIVAFKEAELDMSGTKATAAKIIGDTDADIPAKGAKGGKGAAAITEATKTTAIIPAKEMGKALTRGGNVGQTEIAKDNSESSKTVVPRNAIQIGWMDMRDAYWAQSWHPNVFHEQIKMHRMRPQGTHQVGRAKRRRFIVRWGPDGELLKTVRSAAEIEAIEMAKKPIDIKDRMKALLAAEAVRMAKKTDNIRRVSTATLKGLGKPARSTSHNQQQPEETISLWQRFTLRKWLPSFSSSARPKQEV